MSDEAPAETPLSKIALIEAILYLESDPLEKAVLAKIAGIPVNEVEDALAILQERYAMEESGVELSNVSGGVMLSPKKELWEVLREHYGKKNEGRLSRAAMETLAIIAYSQPVTRSEIESIRGVDPGNMISLLIERALIRETGKKDVPGKPAQYGTTKEFLRFFRLESIADLPRLSDGDADKFELQSEN